MVLPFIIHASFLVISVGFTYLWTQNPSLNNYSLQLTAVLVLLYFASRILLKSRSRAFDMQSTIILISICLLLVFSTGGIKSPLFFLLNFLLFALALLFEPWQAASLSLLFTITILVKTNFQLDNTDIFNLLSLLSITPVAIIFGRKYLDSQVVAGKIAILETDLAREETDTFLWVSTKMKPTVESILDTTSLIIGANTLPFSLQEKIKKAHLDLINLHRSAGDLENEIEK